MRGAETAVTLFFTWVLHAGGDLCVDIAVSTWRWWWRRSVHGVLKVSPNLSNKLSVVSRRFGLVTYVPVPAVALSNNGHQMSPHPIFSFVDLRGPRLTIIRLMNTEPNRNIIDVFGFNSTFNTIETITRYLYPRIECSQPRR